MKKIGLFLPLIGLVFATTVFAYSGSHNFLSMVTTTSDNHLYKSEYRASGIFPFNGAGVFDNSRVNLKGIFSVSEIDGVATSQVYCVTLKGTLSRSGGKLTATRYADNKCSTVAEKTVYTVSSYNENEIGNFTFVAQDEAGIIYTSSGVHQFTK